MWLMIGLPAAWAACTNGAGDTDGGSDAGIDVTVTDSGAADTSKQDTGGGDAGATDSGAKDSGNDVGVVDASDAASPVNGCTTFTDDTADGGIITGPSTATPSQFVPNCVHVKTGQSVTWNADFTDHPLEAAGGTTPSPITLTSSGTTATFAFSSAGTYGFDCMNHPTIMFGAVLVTP
jgi:plastocyanin